jgi:hypothetical protein
MTFKAIISFVIIVTVLSSAFYFTYPFLENELSPLNPNSIENLPEAENLSTEIQFMPNIRFNHNEISYKYEEKCENRKEKMNLAFETIENLSSQISFYETDGEADILVSCSAEKVQESENIFLAGEGGPSSILNLSIYPLIQEGTIHLYEQQNQLPCENPVVEIHELLHVFGYNHLSDKSSLLYPYYHCKQKVPSEIITHLDNLYSQEAKAELFFSNLETEKHSEYLDYKIEIKNEGIIAANEVILTIKEGNTEIDKTDFSTIDSGETKIYTVQNQRLPSKSSNKLTFTISTSTEEYSLENNSQTITF